MRKLKFVWVGKLKRPFWREASEHYLKHLKRSYSLEEIVIKDGKGNVPPEVRNQDEGKRILAAITEKDLPICLDERGEQMRSLKLSQYLRRWSEDANKKPCFILGGAYGLSDEVRKKCRVMMSLSAMTFPHEMARVVLLEQLYRANSILQGSPYHHE